MSITVTLVGEATLGSAGVAVRRYRAPTSAPRKRDVNVDQLQLDQLRMQEIKASNFQGREYQELLRLRLGPPRWWPGWQVTSRLGEARLAG